MKPRAIPVAMLDVSGIVRITRKAGNASSKESQSISLTVPIIKLPTMINAGAVIADTPDNVLTSGPKNAATRKRIETVSEVKPVRPPTATPDEDSIYADVGLVPNIEPRVVAIESASNAWRARELIPFHQSRLLCDSNHCARCIEQSNDEEGKNNTVQAM